MRSARSGDAVLPLTGARTCETNHRGIEGEHLAQCARVRRCKEEHTLTERQNTGAVEQWWNQAGKLGITIQDSPRVQKPVTDKLIVFYSFEL